MGTGAQIASAYFLVVIGLCLHMFSNVMLRPTLFYMTVLLLGMTGAVNGYVVVRIMRLFNAVTEWKETVGLSATILPIYYIATIFLIDVIDWDIDAEAKFNF